MTLHDKEDLRINPPGNKTKYEYSMSISGIELRAFLREFQTFICCSCIIKIMPCSVDSETNVSKKGNSMWQSGGMVELDSEPPNANRYKFTALKTHGF